jgi:hypothetical protein
MEDLKEKGVFKKYLIFARCINEEQYNEYNLSARSKLAKIQSLLHSQSPFLPKIDSILSHLQLFDAYQDRIDKLTHT